MGMQMQMKDNEILKLQMQKRDSEFVMQNNQTRSAISLNNNTTHGATAAVEQKGLARLNSQHSHLTNQTG
jgi:hypothetical protein